MIDQCARPIELPSTTPVATIVRVVAGSFGISPKRLLSDLREFSWERHVAMYISRELTGKSLPVIGRIFNRDHTTILWACRKVEARMAKDAMAFADVRALMAELSPKNVKTGDKSLRKSQDSDKEQSVKMQAERIAA